MEEEDVVPLRLGVRASPPALTLVYKRGSGMERYRVMPIRSLNKFGSVDTVLNELKQRHSQYLAKVPDVRMEKMMRLLQETQKGWAVTAAVETVEREYSLDPLQDLNKLDDHQLAKKKKVMDGSFERNRVSADDPDYEYDKQVEFKTGGQVGEGWDSPDEDFWG
ncbi:hypothetical protein Pcinc_014227 [Petrolisthes cinctipes]|uniref:Centrosomal protein of 19 kDa n=1 Tax=Petrolisthes cinctipes TaxID=88211 RepID=A0AAE1KRK2_PETCI|nr:hypothetical protein Pcinc_014227 [Petrolisthes cinctipes]